MSSRYRLRVRIQVLLLLVVSLLQTSFNCLIIGRLAFVSLTNLLLWNRSCDWHWIFSWATSWAIVIGFFFNIVIGRLACCTCSLLLLGWNSIDTLSELHLLLRNVCSFDFGNTAGDFRSFWRYLQRLVYAGTSFARFRLRMLTICWSLWTRLKLSLIVLLLVGSCVVLFVLLIHISLY